MNPHLFEKYKEIIRKYKNLTMEYENLFAELDADMSEKEIGVSGGVKGSIIRRFKNPTQNE